MSINGFTQHFIVLLIDT